MRNEFNVGLLVQIPIRNLKLFVVGAKAKTFLATFSSSYQHFCGFKRAHMCSHRGQFSGWVCDQLIVLQEAYNSWLFFTDKYQRTQQESLLTHFKSPLENEVTSWPIYRLGMCANRLPTSISFTSPCQVISAWGRRSEIGAAYCAIYFPSFLLHFPHFLSV